MSNRRRQRQRRQQQQQQQQQQQSSKSCWTKCQIVSLLVTAVMVATSLSQGFRWTNVDYHQLFVVPTAAAMASTNLEWITKPLLFSPSKETVPDDEIIINNSSTDVSFRQQHPLPPFPPLSSLIDDRDENITGNVQFLLDFAIIGHSKCGTTTFLQWMKNHPSEASTLSDESYDLRRGRPANLVARLYTLLLPPPKTMTTMLFTNTSIMASQHHNYTRITHRLQQQQHRGYKNPSEIQDQRSMRYLRTYFPQTKLIIGIRHPILWFQSLYNFRIQNMRLPSSSDNNNNSNNNSNNTSSLLSLSLLPHPNRLIGACQKYMKHTCTDSSLFHVHLAKLGKTNLTTMEEMQSFSHSYRQWIFGKHHANQNKNGSGGGSGVVAIVPQFARMPNPIFLYEVTQLQQYPDDSINHRQEQPEKVQQQQQQLLLQRERSLQFRQDVQAFLGFQHELPPIIPHMLPGKTWDDPIQQAFRDASKIDICQDEYMPVRTHLLTTAQEASLWIRRYFLNAPGVIVSSRDYMEELLEQWMYDPCSNKNNNNNNNTTSGSKMTMMSMSMIINHPEAIPLNMTTQNRTKRRRKGRKGKRKIQPQEVEP